MTRILVLTASFGDGHNQAAYAVEEALNQYGAVVKVVDYVEWLHPAVRSFAKFSLLQGVQRIPRLYGLFYKSMSRIQPSSSIQRQLNHLGISHLKRYLRSFNPDLIVSTFPTPIGVVSELRAEGVTDVPNVAIVTDYTAHRQWYHTHTDRYFVATETVQNELVSFGIPPSLVEITGIPLRAKFSEAHVTSLLTQRDEFRRQENLTQDRPVVLIMGGGSGLLGDASEWETCIARVDAQFVIICGHNEKLYRRFEPLQSSRVHVLGYTLDVDRWMAMADIIITKPGGLTLTEALAMELPVLLFRPIPGQEEQNAKYALSTGAAVLAGSVEEATRFLKYICLHPQRLTRMRRAAKAQAIRGGTERIAASIYDMAERHRLSIRRKAPTIPSVVRPS